MHKNKLKSKADESTSLSTEVDFINNPFFVPIHKIGTKWRVEPWRITARFKVGAHIKRGLFCFENW